MNEIIGHPTEIITINQDTTVKAAAIKMVTHKVGCLIVNNKDGKFVGLITDRDIAEHVATSSKNPERTTIAEIMTKQVVTCSPGIATDKARQIMTANRIRHLPIVDNGVVVGILSARDLMGQQLLEDRAAAEEVAMLSKCLKSIELNEAAEIVTKEAPKLFQATNCVLCLYKDESATGPQTQKNAFGNPTKSPELVSYNRCLCPKEHLNRALSSETEGEGKFYYDSIPPDCEKQGAQPPRLVITLQVCSNRSKRLSGYLCMCGLAPSSAANKELASYKAKLTREILTSHLTNASLYQQARLTSLTDALTTVGSRKLLEDKLEAECARAKRYKHPFSVAIIDLDNFKTINDLLGHATGDDALKKLATCMKNQKRTPDVLARYGGDEFVILMPETKDKEALILLERLRAQVQQIKLGENLETDPVRQESQMGFQTPLSMTISCGIAHSLPDCSDSTSEVMRRADIALYEAKSAGRNCVKIWDKNMAKMLNRSDIEIEKIKKLKRHIAGLSEQAEKMFMQSIWGLVQALEAKDAYAKKHSENVMHYAVGIAETMGIGSKHVEVIRRAAMIHDIGKIGVPDAILSKPGRLTPRERKVIEQHPLIAVRILGKMSFLEREMAVVRHHHEKWNGQGYPDGLSKTSIPLGARIIAVADTFDALTSARSYHNSWSVAKAMKILTDSSGYELDPEAVKGMVSWVEQVSSQLGKTLDQLTPDDLLDSQRQLDRSSTDSFVADTAATAIPQRN